LSSYDLDGSSTTKEGTEKVGIKEIIREELRAYLQDPLGFPEEFKGWLPEWITQAGIDIPIGQVIGFTQFTAQAAPTIATAESTTSTSFVDLTTPGPTLTGLPDGVYLILFGAAASISAPGDIALMGVKVNATEAADADTTRTSVDQAESATRAIVKTLDGGGNNTLLARYRSGGGTAAFRNRWLVAIRISNA
jgi:hypothetical protein